MPYSRPQSAVKLSKDERLELVRAYVEHYRLLARTTPEALNRKIPRAAFAPLLDRIGQLLLEEASRAARETGPVRDFLDANPLPGRWAELLPDEFRAFCLAVNALKQWTVAESAATDRFVLGGNARAELRSASDRCLVTGNELGPDAELHHPVRDGRPPVLLSKAGHARIEGQDASNEDDPRSAALIALRTERNRSWALLRRGCLDLLGRNVTHSTASSASSARSFARAAAERTGMSFDDMLSWLDERGLAC